MKIRPEVVKPVILLAIVSTITYIAFKSIVLLLLFIALILLTINFFRDPERTPDSEKNEDILSPADGKVIIVDEGEPRLPFGDEITKKFKRVAIFMSPFDVHVNRAPCSGVVKKMVAIKGGFRRAFLEKAEENSKVVWHIVDENNDNFVVVQIAGAIARRIKTFKREGDKIERGERIGMIYFGSRVDLYFPPKYNIRVKIGDKVYAGKTVICSL